MKYKIASAAIVVFFLMGCVFAWMIYTAKRMADYDRTSSEVGRLSIFIQEFESIHGKYPDSISDLESSGENAERDIITEMVQKRWNGQYEYRSLNDHCQINVRGFRFVCDAMPNGFEIKGEFTTNVVSATIKQGNSAR